MCSLLTFSVSKLSHKKIFKYLYQTLLKLNPMGPGFFLPLKPGGLFRPRTLIANNASLDHGRNFNFWEKIALCMIFPKRYHTFLYLTWFGHNGQSPGGSQMRFVGDFLALKVNATHVRNRFIHYEPANFIK